MHFIWIHIFFSLFPLILWWHESDNQWQISVINIALVFWLIISLPIQIKPRKKAKNPTIMILKERKPKHFELRPGLLWPVSPMCCSIAELSWPPYQEDRMLTRCKKVELGATSSSFSRFSFLFFWNPSLDTKTLEQWVKPSFTSGQMLSRGLPYWRCVCVKHSV